MNIDISILYLFVAVSFGLIGIGYLLRFSIPISLLVFVAGGLMTSLFIITDNIVVGHSVDPIGSSVLYHYNVESGAGTSSISGLTNPQIRGEYIFSTSSMLYLDEIDCIDVLLRKVGSPTLTYTVGIFDHAQADSDPLILSFGTGDSSMLNTIFEWKTFCLPVGQTYVLGDQDVAGVLYQEASTTNIIQIGVASQDVFDSSNTEHSSQSSSTFAWSNFGTTDTNMRLYLRSEAGFFTTEITSPFTEELKVFMVLMGVIMLLVGSAVEFQSRRGN